MNCNCPGCGCARCCCGGKTLFGGRSIGQEPGIPAIFGGKALGPAMQAPQPGVPGGTPGGDDLVGQVRRLIQQVQGLLAKLGVAVGAALPEAGNAAGPGADGAWAPAPTGAVPVQAGMAPGAAQDPAAAPAAPAETAQAAAGPTDAQAGQFEKRLFELVNQVRRDMGLPQVQWNDEMARLARRSAQAKTHTAAPEVLAPYGYSSPEEAMAAWRQSPGHWGIITDPNLTQMGAGWVGDGAAMTFGTVSFPGWEGR